MKYHSQNLRNCLISMYNSSAIKIYIVTQLLNKFYQILYDKGNISKLAEYLIDDKVSLVFMKSPNCVYFSCFIEYLFSKYV